MLRRLFMTVLALVALLIYASSGSAQEKLRLAWSGGVALYISNLYKLCETLKGEGASWR